MIHSHTWSLNVAYVSYISFVISYWYYIVYHSSCTLSTLWHFFIRNLNFDYYLDFNNLNYWYGKTTGLIFMKFTQFIADGI